MSTRQLSIFIARIALFVIYFWFGLLKVVGQSPASPMVEHLFDKTMSGIPLLSFGMFIVLFGLFEMLVGLLFLVPGWERSALVVFFIHMITTSLPLFMLGGEIWTKMFVPTLEGQYIIKNLALIACALSIYSIASKKVTENVTI